MNGYDVDRVEALLRERAHGLTRTPFGSRRRSTPSDPTPSVAAPAALLEPEPPQAEEPPAPARPEGACHACSRPIGLARLRAVPHAVRCIDCQFAFEAGGIAPQLARA